MKLGKPLVAFAMGDPAGISSEIAARLLHSAKIRAAADIVAFGDVRVLEAGAKVAGVALDVDFVSNIDKVPDRSTRPVLVDLASLDPNDIKIGQVSQRGGAFAIENFRTALRYAAEGKAAAVFFTPFNKKAMRLAHASYDDEITFVREMIMSAPLVNSMSWTIYGMRASRRTSRCRRWRGRSRKSRSFEV